MNIVLDTNSLIMSIAPKSPYRKIWNAFLQGDYNLCVSNEIIEEYSEVLARRVKGTGSCPARIHRRAASHKRQGCQ